MFHYGRAFAINDLAVDPDFQGRGVASILLERCMADVKGRGMKENTQRACKEFGAIHCVFPVGNAVVVAVEVEEIVKAEWRDLGMPETLWNCRVKEFGPLIVSIDSEGRNYFEEKKVEYNQRKDEQVAEICKQVGFIK